MWYKIAARIAEVPEESGKSAQEKLATIPENMQAIKRFAWGLGITDEAAIEGIKSGKYQGRLINGEWYAEKPEEPEKTESKAGFGKTVGILMILAGVLFGVLALAMDVTAPGSNVVNLSLMNQQQNFVLIAGVVFIAGILMTALSGKKK